MRPEKDFCIKGLKRRGFTERFYIFLASKKYGKIGGYYWLLNFYRTMKKSIYPVFLILFLSFSVFAEEATEADPVRIEQPVWGLQWAQQAEADGSESFYEATRVLGGNVVKVTWSHHCEQALPKADDILNFEREELDKILSNLFVLHSIPVVRPFQGLSLISEIKSFCGILDQEIKKLFAGTQQSTERSFHVNAFNAEESFVFKIVLTKTGRENRCTARLITYSINESSPDHLIYFVISALFSSGKNNAIAWNAIGGLLCLCGLAGVAQGAWEKYRNPWAAQTRNAVGIAIVGGLFLVGLIECWRDVYRSYEGPYWKQVQEQ